MTIRIAATVIIKGRKTGRFQRCQDSFLSDNLKSPDTFVFAAEHAAKRGGGRVRGRSGFDHNTHQGDAFAEIACPQPSAATLAELRELADRLLARLPDQLLRDLAVARMAGKTVDELSGEFKIAPRTVERKLAIIRRVWSQDAPP